MTADSQEVANSREKSTPRTYFVSEVAADAMRRSLSLLTFSRQCWMCRQGFEIPQAIAASPQEFIATISGHCSREQDYLLPDTPLMEAIFKTLLAHGNEPMDAEQISEYLSAKWVITPFSRNTSPWVIQRLLNNCEYYYCVVSSDSEYGREEKITSRKTDQAKPSSQSERKNPRRGVKGGAEVEKKSENNEEQRVGASAPITNSEDKSEETGSENDEGGVDAQGDAPSNFAVLKPFESLFFDALTLNPSNAPDMPDILPEGGPKTSESAEKDTAKGSEVGRSGARIPKVVTRWQPSEAAQDLADRFREMVLSDYGSRCQVCGSTFRDVSGNLHTSVIRVVPPASDKRTNNLGNLMGLCGRHYDYIRYGEWAMLDPKTNEPFQSPEELRDYFLKASTEIDDNGNSFVSVPVRFSNIYPEGSETPTSEEETIKYSIPHWKYLCVLFGGTPE